MPVRVALGVLYAPIPCPYCGIFVSDLEMSRPWKYSSKKSSVNGIPCRACKGFGYVLANVSHLNVGVVAKKIATGEMDGD